MSWDDTHPSEVSPVQQVRESLRSVALDYSLSARLLAKWKHELSQLVTGFVCRTESPVHNVDSYNIDLVKIHNVMWLKHIYNTKTIKLCISFGKQWLVSWFTHHIQTGRRHVPPWNSQTQIDWWLRWEFPLQYTHLNTPDNRWWSTRVICNTCLS